MGKPKGLLMLALVIVVFISGCDNENQNTAVLRDSPSYELETLKTAWLSQHLPPETVAYFNLPTPWNYLFDAKADALHKVQELPAHQQQVEQIKQGFKSSYFEYLPSQYHSLGSLLVENTATSIELAVINYSPSALLPTVAVGTRLKNIKADQLIAEIKALMTAIDPSFLLEQIDNKNIWSFKTGQFPALIQFDETTGQLLVYGGMGAKQEKLAALWNGADANQSSAILKLNQQADPSGLNMKMWLAPARMYQLGGAFVPPEQKQLITELGLDQLTHIWAGFESNLGQSAFAVHAMMPETGWRKMLPTPQDWFDVNIAGQPRSVFQLTLPTSEQVKHIIETLKLEEKLTDSDRKQMAVWKKMGEDLGFDFYDLLDAYYQQVFMVKDDSGSWIAMKTKNKALRDRIDESFYDYFKIDASSQNLEGVEIMQAHFSIYRKLFEQQTELPADAKEIQKFLNVFKDHVYWFEENDVTYMSRVPQVLAMKKNHNKPIKLSQWLESNQGGDWDGAMFAYGKDVKDLPQDMYHYYLQIIQAMGDLAQVEVDLFALPTADQLNLPEHGRLNLSLSADAEKVSFKFGYEYSLLEPLVSAEGGITTLAVIGVLAATAIPAYKDYTIRAKVIEQLSLASGLKVILSERMMVVDEFDAETFAGVEDEFYQPELDYYIDQETGMIVINMGAVDDSFSEDDELYLEPLFETGYINWICYATFKDAYLPSSCKY
ncbi:pilin [Marinicella sp. S1101]|uniref:pilin n=1 Tax=Marinicella marina TaxID=2996016 RepID=UPI002260E029|nr:pilin [Marinicella marina]MCX7553789.1 pilin [Marinicella marina]MDJ1140864.1 pilin [Marinicella marina]